VGAASASPADLISLTRPFTAKLAGSYGETVNVAVKSGDQILYVDVLQSGHRLRTEIPAGGRDHIHSTALGKAILAELPEGEARAILTTIHLIPVTPNTVTTVPALLRQLTAIRGAGYAVDDEENEIGSVCIAAAITDAAGTRTRLLAEIDHPACASATAWTGRQTEAPSTSPTASTS
jgi:IclR family transcriptional regulator, acetate operon repressor